VLALAQHDPHKPHGGAQDAAQGKGASGTEFLGGEDYGYFTHGSLGCWIFFDETSKDERKLRMMFG
jgi:hypothetical protein